MEGRKGVCERWREGRVCVRDGEKEGGEI
jgi:hypothetical protein